MSCRIWYTFLNGPVHLCQTHTVIFPPLLTIIGLMVKLASRKTLLFPCTWKAWKGTIYTCLSNRQNRWLQTSYEPFERLWIKILVSSCGGLCGESTWSLAYCCDSTIYKGKWGLYFVHGRLPNYEILPGWLPNTLHLRRTLQGSLRDLNFKVVKLVWPLPKTKMTEFSLRMALIRASMN